VNIIKLMTDVQMPAVNTLDSYSNWYERVSKQPLEPIYPISVLKNSNRTLGGLPSVLISREKILSGSFKNFLMERMMECFNHSLCDAIQLYQDITGN
jgi:hypothetical protein